MRTGVISTAFNLLLHLFLPAELPLMLPDVVVLLNVDLVKHHVLLLGVYISFHLHGNVAGKH